MLGPWVKVNFGAGQAEDEKVSVNKTGWEWENLIQMNIISTTVGKNSLEEVE